MSLFDNSAFGFEGVLLDRRKNEPKLEATGGGDVKPVDDSALSSDCEASGNVVEGAEPLTFRKEENRPIRGRLVDKSVSGRATSAEALGDGVLTAMPVSPPPGKCATERCFAKREPKNEPIFVAKLAALPPTSAAPARTVTDLESVTLSDMMTKQRTGPHLDLISVEAVPHQQA